MKIDMDLLTRSSTTDTADHGKKTRQARVASPKGTKREALNPGPSFRWGIRRCLESEGTGLRGTTELSTLYPMGRNADAPWVFKPPCGNVIPRYPDRSRVYTQGQKCGVVGWTGQHITPTRITPSLPL